MTANAGSTRRQVLRAVLALSAAGMLAACGSTPSPKHRYPHPSQDKFLSNLHAQGAEREILMYVMSLLGVGYQFGGKNPEAGLDCSGLVRYVYQNALGIHLPGNAAQIASVTKPIHDNNLRVGDLVFFNTLNRPFSHVGIFIGDQKFVHAPRSHSVIQVARLDNPYFSSRYEGARTVLFK